MGAGGGGGGGGGGEEEMKKEKKKKKVKRKLIFNGTIKANNTCTNFRISILNIPHVSLVFIISSKLASSSAFCVLTLLGNDLKNKNKLQDQVKLVMKKIVAVK